MLSKRAAWWPQALIAPFQSLGDRLGLFKGLWEHGPCTSEQLAQALSLHERWVREWLYHQTCIGQVEFSDEAGVFSLSPEAHAVLVDQSHPAFLMGGYDSALAVFPAVEKARAIFSYRHWYEL